MLETALPRRRFLKAAAGGAAVLAGSAQPASARASAPGTVQSSAPPLKLGVASYSLREFPRDQAIERVKALGVPYINLKSFHLDYDLSAAELAAARAEVEAAGLVIMGGGTITFEQDADDEVRKYFDYARGGGLPLLVATANPVILPRIERFAKEYDIKVAIHNHGLEDEFYPSPYHALDHVKSMDPRMGLCIDIGHTARTGVDVVQSIADAGSRLLDMHAKDLRDLADRESQCIVGEGAMPFPEIFWQLEIMGYQGCVNLEYEIDPEDPMPGMKQSFAYLRGVLAGMATAA